MTWTYKEKTEYLPLLKFNINYLIQNKKSKYN